MNVLCSSRKRAESWARTLRFLNALPPPTLQHWRWSKSRSSWHLSQLNGRLANWDVWISVGVCCYGIRFEGLCHCFWPLSHHEIHQLSTRVEVHTLGTERTASPHAPAVASGLRRRPSLEPCGWCCPRGWSLGWQGGDTVCVSQGTRTKHPGPLVRSRNKGQLPVL